MIAYKGFQKDLKCRGFQFQEYGINETEKANCRQNGFHCAENPLDCLCYYPNWKNSVYYIVDASGDLDEDGEDSKISCTQMRLLLTCRNIQTGNGTPMLQKKAGPAATDFALYVEKTPKPKDKRAIYCYF